MSIARVRNEYQGRWIINQGWLSKETIRLAFDKVPPDPDKDLCAFLVSRGLISSERAVQARHAAERAVNARHPSAGQGSGSGEFVPGAYPGSGSGSGEHRSPLSHAHSDKIQRQPRRLSDRLKKELVAGPHEPPPPVHRPNKAKPAKVHDTVPDAAAGQFTLQAGATVAGYELLNEVSRGAMGVIFRAQQLDSARIVALKFMLQDHPNETEVARFRHEAATLIPIKHDHIIEIIDFGSEAGHLFYAMELVDGQDLYTIVLDRLKIESETPSWEEILPLVKGIAEALLFCHQRNIVHRDVKPQNILVETEGHRSILVDFGLIKKTHGNTTDGLTKTGEMVGTPAFMSPEQFSPGGSYGEVGFASDVWGFGATVFFCMAGHPPFNKPTMVEIFQAISFEDVPSLKKLNPKTPDWLEELVQDCLKKQTRERPKMDEVLARLTGEVRRLSAKRSRRTFALSGLVAVMLLAVIGFIGSLLLAPPSLVAVNAESNKVRSSRVLISGQASYGPSELRILGKKVVTDDIGVFEEFVELQEGRNEIHVLLLHKGQSIATETVLVERDSTPPKIKLRLETDKLSGHYLLDLSNTISGHVQDSHLEDLVLEDDQGQKIKLKPDKSGVFKHTLNKSTKPQELSLRASDSFGNKQQFGFTVLSLEARMATLDPLKMTPEQKAQHYQITQSQDGEGQSWALLCDWTAWRDASSAERKRCAEMVQARLKAHVQFKGLQVFDCEGLKLEIAVFVHGQSKLELSLVPGGIYKRVWWQDPEAAFLYDSMAALEREPFRVNLIPMLLYREPFGGFRDQFQTLVGERLSRSKSMMPQMQFPAYLSLLKKIKQKEGMKEKIRIWAKQKKDSVLIKFRRFFTREWAAPILISRTEVPLSVWAIYQNSRGYEKYRASTSPLRCSYQEAVDILREFKPMRLPSPLEWLWACAGARPDSRYFWGDDTKLLKKYVHAFDSMESIFAGGGFAGRKDTKDHKDATNAFGLSDTLGNMAEWIEPDWDVYAQRMRAHNVRLTKDRSNQVMLAGGNLYQHIDLCHRDQMTVDTNDRKDSRRNLFGMRPVIAIPSK